MGHRFRELERTIDRRQLTLLLPQLAHLATRRTRLRLCHLSRPRQRHSLRRNLRHGLAQTMGRRLHLCEPRLALQQFPHRNLQPIGQAQKRLPLRLAHLLAHHRRSSLNAQLLHWAAHLAQLQPTAYKILLISPIDVPPTHKTLRK